MRICPRCGGFFDDSIMICPIDGYDFSIVIREEKRKRIIAAIRKSSIYLFYASLILSIITSLLLLALSGIFSGSPVFQNRIGYMASRTSALFSENNPFQQRIKNVGSGLDTILSRFQDVYIRKEETKIRSRSLEEDAATAVNRLAEFHIDLDRITRRWQFAVYHGKQNFSRMRGVSD